MAARDAEFNNYLIEALRNKIRHPRDNSFKLGKYNFDYEYIFQQSRRIFPQKYSIAHSYLKGTPISYLDKQALNDLNLEYANDLVEGFGGLDKTQATAKEIDPSLTAYLEDPPEEPDSFYQELEGHQLPEQPEEEQGQGQESGEEQSDTSGQLPNRQPPPRYVIQRPLTNKERFGTKENYAKYKEANKESRDLEARRLWDQRKRSRMSPEEWNRYREQNKDERSERAKKLWDRRKAGVLKPGAAKGGWNPLGDWAAKKIGEKIAQSKLGQAVARNFIDPLKQAITNSRAWQAVAPRLQPIANLLDKIASPFRAISNALGAPERWLSARMGDLANWAGRGLQNGLAQAARGIGNQISNLFNWGRNNPIPTLGVPTGVTAGWGYITAAVAGISLAAWIVIIALIASFVFYIFAAFDLNSECGKPGTPSILKSVINGKGDQQGNKVFQQGEQINYQIQVLYQLKCGGYVDVDVKDTIPTGTTYVEGSIKADTQVDWQGLAGTTSTQGKDGNTLFWNIKSLPNRYPITLNFSVTADQSNLWIPNEVQATFKAYGRFGGALSEGGFPPTQDNCNGKYKLDNPIGNFGDPKCDFDQDKLYAMLQQLDPAEAAYWFTVLIPKETLPPYNPNSYNPGSTSGRGAYGLFQMNPDNEKSQYDIGNVDWQRQVSNAINYNNYLATLGRTWCYWEAAMPRWPAICRRL